MNFFLVLITFVFAISSFGQETHLSYYQDIAKAKDVSQNNHVDSAIIMYELAFEKIEYVHSTFIHEILELCKKSNDRVRIKKYKAFIKDKKKCKNSDFLDKVDSILVYDQKIRKNPFQKNIRFYNQCVQDSLCDKTSNEFATAEAYYLKALAVARSNEKAILKLINDEGEYKGEAILGSKKEYNLFVMLLHFDNDTNNRVLGPIIEKALSKGFITPLSYSLLLDRHLYHTTGTQKYWAWPLLSWDPQLNQEEIDKANDFRKKIGLSSTIKSIDKRGKDWIITNTSVNKN